VSPLAKKLVWALGISLGLNLFLLGFGVARQLGPHPFPGGHPAGDHPGDGFGKRGPARWFGPHAPALRAQRGELLRAREKVGEALRAEPFDREALTAALLELRKASSQAQTQLHEALIETAQRLSPEERKNLAHSRLLHDVSGDRRP
jgi:hypothetical protein